MNQPPTKQTAGIGLPPLPADVTPPRVLQTAKPIYPQAPQYKGIQGCAWVSFDISETGKPVNLNVILSAPTADFGYSALNTIAKWRFVPAMKDGHPIRIDGAAQEFIYRLGPTAPAYYGVRVQQMPDCSFPGTHASRPEGIDTTSASGYGRRLVDLKSE